MKPTITEQQAVDQVDQYINQAMHAIGTGRLEQVGRSVGPCNHPSDNGPQGRVQAHAGYFIKDVPTEDNLRVFQAIRDWWKRNNFHTLTDNDQPYRYLWGENRDNAFRMALRESSEGSRTLSIIVSSPCVWPNGTPEPE